MRSGRIHTTRNGKHTVRNIIVIGALALSTCVLTGCNQFKGATISCTNNAAGGLDCKLVDLQVETGVPIVQDLPVVGEFAKVDRAVAVSPPAPVYSTPVVAPVPLKTIEK